MITKNNNITIFQCSLCENGTLTDLSARSLSLPVSEALASAISESTSLFELDLSDCNTLSKDTLGILLEKGVAKSASIRVLNLKGSDLDGRTVSLLGKVLQVNNSLLRMSLEWNNIGVNLEAFSAFCSGLQANIKLETLNLRLVNSSRA